MDSKTYIFFRIDRAYVKVMFSDIIYIESKQHFVRIKTKDKVLLVLISIRQLETDLPAHMFARVHRSFLVGLAHVTSFDQKQVQLGEATIPIGIGQRGKLETLLPVMIADARPSQDLSKGRMRVVLNEKKMHTAS